MSHETNSESDGETDTPHKLTVAERKAVADLEECGFTGIEKLQTGHFCLSVFKARLGTVSCAVKICAAKHSRWLANEAAILAQLEHRYVVRALGGYQLASSCRAYLTLELVHGVDILTLVARQSDEISLAQCSRPIRIVARRTLKALAYVHSQGILHNDIKPDNVLVGCRELSHVRNRTAVKLCDFGLASREGADKDNVGSHGYVAPEKLFWAAKATRASDVFSFGMFFFACCTGRMMFDVSPKKTWPNELTLAKFERKLAETLADIADATKFGAAEHAYLRLFSDDERANAVMLHSTCMTSSDRWTARELLLLPYFSKSTESV